MYPNDYRLFDMEKEMDGIVIRKIVRDDHGNQHAEYEYGETPQRAFEIIENAECRLRSKQNLINELLRKIEKLEKCEMDDHPGHRDAGCPDTEDDIISRYEERISSMEKEMQFYRGKLSVYDGLFKPYRAYGDGIEQECLKRYGIL